MRSIKNATASNTKTSLLATNQVLRNTYFLLSLTLLFSSICAYIAIVSNAQPFGVLVLLVGMFGLYFLTMALRNSAWGLLAIFAYTGFMGYAIGPVVNMYIHNFTNGSQIVMTALGTTGLIFLVLSGYVLTTRKNFSYLGGFIAALAMVAFIGALAGLFFHMPMLQLLISGAFALVSAGYILYMTSEIIHGGETNYIIATITLYVAIFNLFVSLLRIFGAFAGGGSSRS